MLRYISSYRHVRNIIFPQDGRCKPRSMSVIVNSRGGGGGGGSDITVDKYTPPPGGGAMTMAEHAANRSNMYLGRSNSLQVMQGIVVFHLNHYGSEYLML